MKTEIDRSVAAKVLATVDAGLCSGVGVPEPGKMCVEAAVCYALGQPHGDEPVCVSPALRAFKIRLNDAGWSSNAARARGLRRIALAQLGSAGVLDERTFAMRLSEWTIRNVVPRALRAAARLASPQSQALLEEAAARCELEGTESAARSAESAARSAESAARSAESAESAARSAESARSARSAESAAWSAESAAWSAWSAESAARSAESAESAAMAAESGDALLAFVAEGAVQILLSMNAPGCQWLDLAPL